MIEDGDHYGQKIPWRLSVLLHSFFLKAYVRSEVFDHFDLQEFSNSRAR